MILAAVFWEKAITFFATKGWDIVLAISILIIAFVSIKIVSSILTRLLYKTRIDGSAIAFYIALIKAVLWILTIFAVADVLSISTSSLVVGLSSVAIAIALALKDSLSNLANGILIIYNKPFRRGDMIEIEGVSGQIRNIKLFATELVTPDNRRIIIPNSKIVNGTIINTTSLSTRRISMDFCVSYDSDPDLVEKVLKSAFEDNKLVNKTPAVNVFMSEHGESAIKFTVRCWVDTEDYWDVYNGMTRVVFDRFAENGIAVPYNQLDVHLISDGKADNSINGGEENE